MSRFPIFNKAERQYLDFLQYYILKNCVSRELKKNPNPSYDVYNCLCLYVV